MVYYVLPWFQWKKKQTNKRKEHLVFFWDLILDFFHIWTDRIDPAIFLGNLFICICFGWPRIGQRFTPDWPGLPRIAPGLTPDRPWIDPWSPWERKVSGFRRLVCQWNFPTKPFCLSLPSNHWCLLLPGEGDYLFCVCTKQSLKMCRLDSTWLLFDISIL